MLNKSEKCYTIRWNIIKKSEKLYIKDVQRMTIGFCKKLPLEINQNPDFCKFREKAKVLPLFLFKKHEKMWCTRVKLNLALK